MKKSDHGQNRMANWMGWDSVERFHNRLSDTDFVWFPFLFLKLKPHQQMTWPHIFKMSPIFGFYFCLMYFLKNAIFDIIPSKANIEVVYMHFTLGFFVWFSVVTRFFWNRRARRLISQIVVVMLFTVAFLPWQAVAAETTESELGLAKNDAGVVVYTEKHVITYTDKKLDRARTEYLNASGKLIAIMTSDYRQSISMPTYNFTDMRFGTTEGLRLEDGKYVVYYKNEKSVEKTAPLEKTSGVYSCQGWHYYLTQNLQQLEQADITLILLVPSRLDSFTFKVLKNNSTGDLISASLRLDNWLLNLFAPNVELVYSKSGKSLVSYKGISNIMTDSGASQNVTITYNK